LYTKDQRETLKEMKIKEKEKEKEILTSSCNSNTYQRRNDSYL
jgi:hypothetical protein